MRIFEPTGKRTGEAFRFSGTAIGGAHGVHNGGVWDCGRFSALTDLPVLS